MTNARLVVIGPHHKVLRFSRRTPLSRPTFVFGQEELDGETDPAFSERIERLSLRASRKVYKFQQCFRDQYHYALVSKADKALAFILVLMDWDTNETEGYLIQNGHLKRYRLPYRSWRKMLSDRDYDTDNNDDIWKYWEASWEAMDVCQGKCESWLRL